MSHKPGHIEGTIYGDTWNQLYEEAKGKGLNPEADAITVTDESRMTALQALAVIGGATVTSTDGGVTVQLAFDEEAEAEEHEIEEATAAAKAHTFANKDKN